MTLLLHVLNVSFLFRMYHMYNVADAIPVCGIIIHVHTIESK